jgi:hypothetical protein
MMTWITMILRNWQLVVIASLSLALTLSIAHGRFVSLERDLKIAEIQRITDRAIEYQSRSDEIVKEVNRDRIALVDEISKKNTAIENAKKRFSTCPPVRNLGAVGMPIIESSDGQTHSSSIPDGTGSELVVTREFIDACAFDAGTVTLWQHWAVGNSLPVSKD